MIVTTRTMGTGNESLKFNLRAQRMISSRLPREKQARKHLRAPNPDGLTIVGHCLGIVIGAFEMSCVEQNEVLDCKEEVEMSIRHCWVFNWDPVSFVRRGNR